MTSQDRGNRPINIKRLYLPVAVFCVIALSAFSASRTSRSNIDDAMRGRFEREAAKIEAALLARWAAQEQVLRSGVALLSTNPDLTRREWARFVSELRLGDAYPGIQGVGWAVTIPHAELAAHERQFSRETAAMGLEEYSVYPVPGNDHHADLLTSILYLEPLDERNRRAISLDMYSETNRRTAMERARLTGEPALSAKILLVQEIDEDQQPGFLLYLPVYRGHPMTAQERVEQLVGWVYSPFRARDLMTGVLGDVDMHVTFEVFDSRDVNRGNVLFDSDGQLSLANSRTPRFRLDRDLTIAGHHWRVRYDTTPAFVVEADSTLPALLMIGGVVLGLALGGLVDNMARTRSNAVAIATTMTEGLRASEAEKDRLADTLRRSNNDLRQFASVASHDLQEPARTMQAYLGLIETDYGDLLGVEGRDYLKTAKGSAVRMRSLIQDLLEYSQVTQMPKADAVTPLSDALEQALQEAKASIAEASPHIIIGELPSVRADHRSVVRVFSNLLSNATKYRNGNSCQIIVRASTTKGMVKVEVEDNGIGIRPDDLPRLFAMNARLHSRDDYPGNGMGLAISRQIIERAGGTMGVESVYGESSTFWFTLEAA